MPSNQIVAPPQPGAALGRAYAPTTEFVVRALVVAAAVTLGHQLPWNSLRYLTSEWVLRLVGVAGIGMQRLSSDTVLWNGQAYQFVIACCFIDVWFGAVPLLWDIHRTTIANAMRMAVLFVALMALNVFRLSLSFVLCSASGWSWDSVHGIVGGLAYFAVWVWIWQHRPWRAFAGEARRSPA